MLKQMERKYFILLSAENEKEDVSKNLLEALKASIQQKTKPKR